jgi:hypothetical protein
VIARALLAAALAFAGAPAWAFTEAGILGKYDLSRLSQAAVALQAIIDLGLEAPGANPGSALLGCRISGAEAMAWLRGLHDLIDRQSAKARSAYAQNPRALAPALASCQAACACGDYASLLEGAFPARAEDREWHAKALASAREKASALSPPQVVACARRQKWFCRSALRAYLEGGSGLWEGRG